MTSRPVVSYDDITLPYDTSDRPQPPQKKRKRHNTSNTHKKVPHHWDDPTPATPDEDQAMDDEESRELTHEEIWDDSALIDAWNAAMEEYEAYHGPDKGWKKEPVHKSPLSVFSPSPHPTYSLPCRWYNIPPKNTPKKPPATTTIGPQLPDLQAEPDEPNSQPIDFDTFVPTHNPSLLDGAATTVAPTEEDAQQAGYAVPLTHLPSVSQDEAFERAMQASYWSGYWAAVYHVHSSSLLHAFTHARPSVTGRAKNSSLPTGQQTSQKRRRKNKKAARTKTAKMKAKAKRMKSLYLHRDSFASMSTVIPPTLCALRQTYA